MLSLLLAASTLLGIDPANPPPSERDSYEAALEEVGRTADAQVRLALWCEAHGLQAERLKHLTLAVLKEPGHPLARGLLGVVAYGGRWRRPEAVGDALAEDARRKELLSQYEERRGRLVETAEAHWRLALWCEENGLKAEATAHLWSSLRLDPSREGAWKRLGYKRHNGRWVTDAQLSRAKDEAEAQKRADRHWRPILEKWRSEMTDAKEARRVEALDGLAGVVDPRAVPAVLEVFASGDEPRQRVAVQVLGQIDSAASSRGLAFLALSGVSAEVRRASIETLRGRDVREYAGPLIALLLDPVKYEVRPVNGPGMPGSIVIEGDKVNLQRRYEAPPLPQIRFNANREHLEYDEDGLPVIIANRRNRGQAPSGLVYVPRANDPVFGWGGNGYAQQQWGTTGSEYRPMLVAVPTTPSLGRPTNQPISIGRAILNTELAAVEAQQKLATDVAEIETHNAQVEESNERVVHVLDGATGAGLPSSRLKWQRWLVDQFGYPQKFSQDLPKPTVVQEVTPNLPPVSGFASSPAGYSQVVSHHSCFGAGTPVHTIKGLRPIESLRVGDLVLTQDTTTGALGYKPIVAVHHNPPIETFRITYGRETVVSSAFHRFWKAGKGWAMARDLKTGDILRTLGGSARIDAVEPDAKQLVYNLDVAEAADFFVGEAGALVHDHSLPDLRIPPFDARPDLLAAGPR